MPITVGTSGWQYRPWRGVLYPTKLPQSEWLTHFADRFPIVEVNSTFYRLPERSTFEAWYEQTPSSFQFALKISRYLTHIKRLRDPEEPIRRFLQHAAPLRDKLGPILLQLPPDFPVDPVRLGDTLACFPEDMRVAVEFRHASWFTPEIRGLLEQRDVALCLADRRSRLQTPLWRTATWGYIRLHEGRAHPRPCYGQAALGGWVRRIEQMWGDKSEVYVLFNNDPLGCAIRNAHDLRAMLGMRTLSVKQRR